MTAMARHRVRVQIRRWFDGNVGQACGIPAMVAWTRADAGVVEQVLGELLAAGELERCAGGYRAMKELNHVERNRD